MKAYQKISTILEQYDTDLEASEAHGVAVGMLCVDIRAGAESWLQQIFHDEVVLRDDDKAALTELFEHTRNLLDAEDEQFVFDLLLPEDNDELFQRAEALRCWCQGFLYGIGYVKSGSGWPGECGEIMRDIVEFTKLDSDVGGEEDENAFMEIHEYLRSAVLLVRDQFAQGFDKQSRH